LRNSPNSFQAGAEARHTWRERQVNTMKNKVIALTGHKAPASGQYRPSGSRKEITLTKGEITPPNNGGSRQRFVLVDKTKHKHK
jgi:hypothetical protein